MPICCSLTVPLSGNFVGSSRSSLCAFGFAIFDTEATEQTIYVHECCKKIFTKLKNVSNPNICFISNRVLIAGDRHMLCFSGCMFYFYFLNLNWTQKTIKFSKYFHSKFYRLLKHRMLYFRFKIARTETLYRFSVLACNLIVCCFASSKAYLV